MEAASRALLRRLVAPPPTAAPLHLARMFRHSGIHVKRSLVARGGWCSRRLSTGKVEHRDSQGSRPAAAGAADAAGSADAESFLKQLAQHHSEKGDVEVVVDRDGGLVFNPLPEPDPEAARRMGRHQLRAYLAEVTGVEPVEVGKSGGAKPKAKQPATAAGSPAATGEDDGLGFMPEMAVPGKVEESEDEIVEFNLGKAMATLLEDDDVGTEGQGDSSDHVSAADIAWMRRHFGDAYVDSYLSEDPTEQELEARSVTVERTRRPKGFGFSPVTHKAAEAADINRRGRGRGARAQRVAVIDQGLQELDLLNTRSESGDGGVPKRLRAKLPSVKAAAGPRQYSEIFSVFPHLDDEESGGLGDGFRPDLGAAEDEFDSEADRKMAEFVPRRRFMRRQLYKPQVWRIPACLALHALALNQMHRQNVMVVSLKTTFRTAPIFSLSFYRL